MKLKVKKLREGAILPKYATEGAACFDIHALEVNERKHISSLCHEGNDVTCSTGLAFEIPPGHVMMVYSRSGHGFKYGVRLANVVGVIDSDYRGELMVKLTCDSIDEDAPPLKIDPGARIAQAMILPIPSVELVEAEELSETARGAGGFGSTGA